ncbi:MlaD family protein [Blastomonas sp. SL216]|jgi:phospholipid/cholesterol/gamma-HCH transport system substrate-binding protein|uniref:MlaD family protein n=1 Tax=Blastomonas sp. SL216 TaxID=2995169 RepID=UPI002377AFD4|nr:MlaD family protein [Blastomonas sp. SL216]
METRANHVWVGTVTLVLLAGIAAFVIWLAGLGETDRNKYDIFFKTSVDGIAKGSVVAYSGVPSGQVTEIALWAKDPQFVRVRIEVDAHAPILEGTTATIQGVGFTGVSQIQLDGAKQGAPAITEPGPEGVPVIPTKPGALGELLNNAPLLLERLATLTERFTQVLSDDNQKSIAVLLKNSGRLTGELADSAPQMRAALAELRVTLAKAGVAAEQLGMTAQSTKDVLDSEGRPLARQLAKTLADTDKALIKLTETMEEAKPGLRQFSTTTLPETEALVRDLRVTARALSAITEKIDQEGAGGLLSAPPLPDYKPKN